MRYNAGDLDQVAWHDANQAKEELRASKAESDRLNSIYSQAGQAGYGIAGSLPNQQQQMQNPKRPPGVSVAGATLNDRMNVLTKVASELIVLLEPVLRPEPPSPPTTANEARGYGANTQIGQMFAVATSNADIVINMLRSAIDRLEL